MPRNHDFATHALMRRVAAEGPWRERLRGARDPSPVRSPEFYYDCLAPLSRRVILWETNYIQIMDGVGAIIAWLRGTGLGPFLGRLDPGEQRQFLERYERLLADAFPPRADGRFCCHIRGCSLSPPALTGYGPCEACGDGAISRSRAEQASRRLRFCAQSG